MSSLGYEQLPLAATPQSGSATAPSAESVVNSLYHEWALLGVVIAGLAGLATWLGWVYRSSHRDIKEASLSLEQSASSMFVQVVLMESKRVFALADDHLPLALSQSVSSSPEQSRFDHFCKSLREIPQEQLDDRGHYANVIRESFSRIIAENAERLLDAMRSAGAFVTNPVLNPTGIRFSLEADGYTRFSLISQFDSDNRRLASWFHRTWSATGAAIVIAMIALAAVIPSVLHDAAWAYSLGVRGLWAVAVAVSAAGIFIAIAFVLRHALVQRSQKYGDPSDAQKALDERGRDVTKNH